MNHENIQQPVLQSSIQKMNSRAQSIDNEVSNENEEKGEFHQYFTKFKTKNSWSACSMRNIAETLVSQGIQNGEIIIQREQGHEYNINEYLQNQKIKTEDEEPFKKREKQLQYLKMQISRVSHFNEQQFLKNTDHHILSRKEHREFVKRVWRQRVEIQRKRLNHSKQMIEKIKAQDREKEIEMKEQQEEFKIEKKKKLIASIEQHKNKHEDIMKRQAQSKKIIQNLKNQKMLSDQLQEKYYSEFVLPVIEEKKKKLQQMKEIKKAVNISDLKRHEQQYLELRQKNLEKSKMKRSKGSEQTYKLPAKSQKLTKFLQQQRIETQLKLHQKKRKMQQKIKRKEQFISYLKSRTPPKIDLKKRQEIENRLHIQKRSQRDKNTLGLNYLQQMKRLGKKNSTTTQRLMHRKNTSSDNSSQKAYTNYLYTTKTKQQHDNLRMKRLQKLIQSQDYDKMDKIKKLNIEANKLVEQSRRKQEVSKIKTGSHDPETMELLLASIKAKMTIIDEYNKP